MDLSEFTEATRRRWWLPVGCAIVAAVVALVVSAILPKSYTSESRVLVGSLTATSTDTLTAYQQLAQTYASVLLTPDSLTPVARAVTPDLTPTELLDQISAHAATGSSIVTIDATGRTPAEAARLAQSAAGEILVLAATGSQASLASVIQAAQVPTSPSSPKTTTNAILAGLFGLALGLAGAIGLWAREHRRSALREHARVVSLLEERFGRRAS